MWHLSIPSVLRREFTSVEIPKHLSLRAIKARSVKLNRKSGGAQLIGVARHGSQTS
jgi:hypothetical protein